MNLKEARELATSVNDQNELKKQTLERVLDQIKQEASKGRYTASIVVHPTKNETIEVNSALVSFILNETGDYILAALERRDFQVQSERPEAHETVITGLEGEDSKTTVMSFPQRIFW